MRKFLLLIAFSLFGANAFSLPTIDCDDGEFYFLTEPCATPIVKAKKEAQKSKDDINLLLEVKAGYYWFADSKMRAVYNNGGIDVQVALSGRVWSFLHVYGAVEYIGKNGSSLNAHQSTKIQIVPLSLGLKPTFKVADQLDLYFNIGPRYFFVHQHNYSNYVDQNVNENGLGGFIGTGLYVHLNKRLILDGYAEYSYFERKYNSFETNVTGHSINLGGLAVGGGLGYSF